MRRVLIFFISFGILSGLFVLFTGEGVETEKARTPASSTRAGVGVDRWLWQVVDEEKGRIQARLTAAKFDPIGDVIEDGKEDGKFEGLRLGDLAFEFYEYASRGEGRRTVRLRAPVGSLAGTDMEGS